MPKVIYSMSTSLDGYIADRDGSINWTAPDEELHSFHNDQVRDVGTQLLGRRLYEEMLYWESDERRNSPSSIERDFADIWQRLPKLVFSRTLESVQGNAGLAQRPLAEELAGLMAAPGGDIAVGGAGLASGLVELDLIDEYRLFVKPIVLGGGTPYFPQRSSPIKLELLESRTFGGQVQYLRYARV